MLRSEISYNIKFVEVVKKHQVLYEFTNSGYGFKIEQDKAWAAIAKEMEGSVASVKERWRNLRLGLGRHLRQMKSNLPIRRPYYLAEHMDFLIPYTKSTPKRGRSRKTDQNTSSFDDQQNNDSIAGDNHDDNDFRNGTNDEVKTDNPNVNNSFNNQKDVGVASGVANSLSPHNQIKNEQSVDEHAQHANPQTIQRTIILQQDDQLINDISNQQHQAHQVDCPDLNFLRSILPDVLRMNPSQKAKFKIAVLTSIDRLLYASTTAHEDDAIV